MRRKGKANRPTTIVDVARALGVVPSTVSNALHGKPFVAEATRQRVLAKCAEMNYQASAVARALRTRRSYAIGVLLPDISNPVFSEIVKGIDAVLAPAGFTTLLASTEGRQARHAASIRAFTKRSVDGLVVVSQRVDAPEIQTLLAEGPPTVLIHRRASALAMDYVGMDNVGGLCNAVSHLAEVGHRRIGFITGPADSSAAGERLAGYRSGVRSNGLDEDQGLVVSGDYTLLGGFRAARRLLAMRNPPTAIISSNDLMAFATLDVAGQMGLRVPDDLSVVGVDDIFLSSLPMIGLTTVHQPAEEIGRASARRLLDRLDDEDLKVTETVLPAELIVRHSTAAPATRRRAVKPLSEKGLNDYLRTRWKPTTRVAP